MSDTKERLNKSEHPEGQVAEDHEDFGDEPDRVEVTAFGHKFWVLAGLAEDLITLEREGAMYSHFWDDAIQTFRFYKVPFLPSEIFQYVEAHVAKQRFDLAMLAGATFEEALIAIHDREIAERVESYGNYGHSKLKDGSELDIRGCLASFLTPEMEELVCGQRSDRYELLPNLAGIDKTSLLIQMIDYFPVVARYLSTRGHGKPSFELQNEYDTQDLLFVIVRSVFEDARTEEWTPKHSGKSKRIDIVVPSIGAVIEVKHVRDKVHARGIADELKIDIESYHVHPNCQTLLALVYDPGRYIVDPAEITSDLSGHRVKGTSSFDVRVLIRG